MKNFLSLFSTVLLLSGVLFFTSCGEDDTLGGGTGTDVAPTLSITTPAETTVDGGTTITFTATAAKGTNDLKSLTVTEDGTNIDATRYSITEYTDNGIDLQNPQLLTGNDINNFTYTVNITVPSENSDPEADEDYFYKLIVAGDKDLTAEVELVITVNGVVIVDPGTPTTFMEMGVLLNQAGPSGTGGLDLDILDGGTGSQDASAEIRDLGIDCTVSGSENWRGLFGTVNGADMRQVDLSQVENFTFESATTVEIITGAFDSGIQLGDDVSTAPNCDETTVTDVAQPNVGDMYVISANSKYYLIRVDGVNMVANSNDDNYEFSIKY